MITNEQKAEFNSYADKLDKAIIDSLSTFSRRNLDKVSKLKLINADILKEILINFDREPDNIDNILHFLDYQKSQEEKFKDNEELKGKSLLYIKNGLNGFISHPLILRSIAYHMFAYSEQVSLSQCLFPKQSTGNNSEFKFPVLCYTPPSHSKLKYYNANDHIPTASSNITFESFFTAKRSLGLVIPTSITNAIAKGYIELSVLAVFINDICQDLARCIDTHQMEDHVLNTMKFLSNPIGYIGHNTQLINNNEVRLLVPNDKYKVDNKAYSYSSWTTHDFDIVNNFVAYKSENADEGKVEKRNNILKLILNSAAKMNSSPRYRLPNILFINRTYNSEFKIQKAQHDDVEFKIKEDTGLFNYIGSFGDIDIIETDLIARDIMLLTQRYSIGYGISKLPTLNLDNSNLNVEVKDVVCLPTAKTSKYKEGTINSEDQEHIAINHPGLIIHLIDK